MARRSFFGVWEMECEAGEKGSSETSGVMLEEGNETKGAGNEEESESSIARMEEGRMWESRGEGGAEGLNGEMEGVMWIDRGVKAGRIR